MAQTKHKTQYDITMKQKEIHIEDSYRVDT